MTCIEETRIWRKYEISILLSMMSLFISFICFYRSDILLYILAMMLLFLTTLNIGLISATLFCEKSEFLSWSKNTILQESYYPAMPEDDVEFLTTVMRDFSKEHNLKSWHTGEDKPTFYSEFSFNRTVLDIKKIEMLQKEIYYNEISIVNCFSCVIKFCL